MVIVALALSSAGVAITLLSTGGAMARERVSLPFSCSVDHGRVRVEAGADHSYQILGNRDQQVYTYCPDENGSQCKTWTVHRFAVACTGGRATWPEIVAAAAAVKERGSVGLENGQLLLRVAPQRSVWRERVCRELEPTPWKGPATWEKCLSQGNGGVKLVSRSHMVALPRGYAPLGLIGARLSPDVEPAPRVASIEPVAAVERPVGPVAIERVLPAEKPVVTELPAIAEPRPDRVIEVTATSVAAPSAESPRTLAEPVQAQSVAGESIETVSSERLEAPAAPASAVQSFAAVALGPTVASLPPAPTVDPAIFERAKNELSKVWPVAWTIRVEATPSAAPRNEFGTAASQPPPTQLLLAGLLGMALLVTIAVTRRRRTARVRSHRVDPDLIGVPIYSDGDGERAVALRTKSDGHIALITNALDRLSAVAPLRNALSRELQSSERRLAVVIAAISVPKATREDWTRARRRLERIAQDLDRLQQISDSAVDSLSGVSTTRSLPRDKAEAYATLGITEGVSDAILKKLVDALRVSWHPDLARSDADRELRDARIKEINVAWDLITGKRMSA